MAEVMFMELGFPILLIDPPMVTVRGETLPDVNMKDLQETAFAMLIIKPSRLTGSEVGFIRAYQHLRQADFAAVLNMANHSVVSQWESRLDNPTGMDYNTEVVLRLWMAGRIGRADMISDLLASILKNLSPRSDRPLEIRLPHAA